MKLVQETLSRFVDSGEIAGCAVRIMRNDEVAFEGSFGYADIGKKVPMSSENTIFAIASMSKVVTVAGIMQLYERELRDHGREGRGHHAPALHDDQRRALRLGGYGGRPHPH